MGDLLAGTVEAVGAEVSVKGGSYFLDVCLSILLTRQSVRTLMSGPTWCPRGSNPEPTD